MQYLPIQVGSLGLSQGSGAARSVVRRFGVVSSSLEDTSSVHFSDGNSVCTIFFPAVPCHR
jgi:hypothetical protein